MKIGNRVLAMLLAFITLINTLPLYSMAEELTEESNSYGDTENRSNGNVITPIDPGHDSNTVDAIIMQGNTISASDCVAFENALEASGNGYDSFVRYGWQENSNSPENIRVSASSFATIGSYKIAYYSGHGARINNGAYLPILNAHAGNNAYGSYTPFDVATTLGVSDDNNWGNTCIIDSDDNLRVLILACCYQLDSNIVKYYVRLMKASGIRAIAGYHEQAPSDGDDTIATSFVQQADNGSSIKDAWANVNWNQNWAILVYRENNGQNYRLPDFPNYTLPAVSSAAAVYRYANFLDPYREESTRSLGTGVNPQLSLLPLSITLTSCRNEKSEQTFQRNAIWGDVSVPDNDSAIISTLLTQFGEDVSLKPCVQYHISQEEVDADTGVLPGTEIVVERTYQYFDTYEGVKIVDSYISASIDGDGINRISAQRKAVVSVNANSEAINTGSRSDISLIEEEDALNLLLSNNKNLVTSEYFGSTFAYAPDGNGSHVLCYEFAFSGGLYYVNVVTGEIVNA